MRTSVLLVGVAVGTFLGAAPANAADDTEPLNKFARKGMVVRVRKGFTIPAGGRTADWQKGQLLQTGEGDLNAPWVALSISDTPEYKQDFQAKGEGKTRGRTFKAGERYVIQAVSVTSADDNHMVLLALPGGLGLSAQVVNKKRTETMTLGQFKKCVGPYLAIEPGKK